MNDDQAEALARHRRHRALVAEWHEVDEDDVDSQSASEFAAWVKED